MFMGRKRELALLDKHFRRVVRAVDDERPGRCVLMRGRRRIGKSMLTEHFIQEAEVPSLYFTASSATGADHLAKLLTDVATSTLPDRQRFLDDPPDHWNSALEAVVDILPLDQPSIVVIDELPYLVRDIPGFEGFLQRAWDRFMNRRPVLLVLIGSDISMMEALNTYDRPFYQRGTEMIVGPLTPPEVGEMLHLDASDAFDASLVTGGLPFVCEEWAADGGNLWEFLGRSFDDPTSALLVSGERTIAAEFPVEIRARGVLSAIGSGARTYANLSRAAGGLSPTVLSSALALLDEKRLVRGDQPLSTKPSKERQYRITDSYLRFWLSFVKPGMDNTERHRGDLVLRQVKKSWCTWRGMAVEPLIREALWRLLPDDKLDVSPGAVGSYWTRSSGVEIDIVGADRGPIAKELLFVGSIKWREDGTFEGRDLAALQAHRALLTDELIPTVAVSRCGVSTKGLDAVYGPEDLLAAWK